MSDAGTLFETARSRSLSQGQSDDQEPQSSAHSSADSSEIADADADELLDIIMDDEDVQPQGMDVYTLKFNPDALDVDGDKDSDREPEAEQPMSLTRVSALPSQSSPDFAHVTLEYLITVGYKEAAEKLCEETGIELPKEDADHLDARVLIRDAIESGRIEEAISRVSALCPSLLQQNSAVRFQLMQQNLIEMIRNGETERALEYAQNEVSGTDTPLEGPQLEQLEFTFALLAFEKPQLSPFGKLLEQSHRQKVSTDVNVAVLRALGKPSTPRADILLKMMIWTNQQSRATAHPDEPVSDAKMALSLFGKSTRV